MNGVNTGVCGPICPGNEIPDANRICRRKLSGCILFDCRLLVNGFNGLVVFVLVCSSACLPAILHVWLHWHMPVLQPYNVLPGSLHRHAELLRSHLPEHNMADLSIRSELLHAVLHVQLHYLQREPWTEPSRYRAHRVSLLLWSALLVFTTMHSRLPMSFGAVGKSGHKSMRKWYFAHERACVCESVFVRVCLHVALCLSVVYPVCANGPGTCQSCNGSPVCSSCTSPFFLTGTSCILASACPTGTFPNTANQQCTGNLGSLGSCLTAVFAAACTAALSCATCPSASSCSSCISGTFLLGTACLSQSACAANAGHFPNSATSTCDGTGRVLHFVVSHFVVACFNLNLAVVCSAAAHCFNCTAASICASSFDTYTHTHLRTHTRAQTHTNTRYAGTSCAANYFLYGSQCYSTYPSGFFGLTATRQCTGLLLRAHTRSRSSLFSACSSHCTSCTSASVSCLLYVSV